MDVPAPWTPKTDMPLCFGSCAIYRSLRGPVRGAGWRVCGACTVMDGRSAVRCCQIPIAKAANRAYTTIEGLSENGEHPCQRASVMEDVAQCGYCQAGAIVSAAALLERIPHPSDQDIDAAIGAPSAAAARTTARGAASAGRPNCGGAHDADATRILQQRAGWWSSSSACRRPAGRPRPRCNAPTYIQVTPDNAVRLWISRLGMGQGVRTALAAVLAEELEGGPGGGATGAGDSRRALPGSPAAHQWERQRLGHICGIAQGGRDGARDVAGARRLRRLGRIRAACRASLGAIHDGAGRSLTYGELAAAAARQTTPANAPLKKASEFRLIGKPVKRVDGPDIVRGHAVYGLDVRVPGMLVAVVKHCPHIGGEAARFDAKRALAVPGVRHVVPVRSGLDHGVAVVADHTWAAEKGLSGPEGAMEGGHGQRLHFDSVHRQPEKGFGCRCLSGAAGRRGQRGDATGGGVRVSVSGARAARADEYRGRCARRAVRDLGAFADARDGGATHAAKALEVAAEAVTVHTTLMGGGFGRRLFVDYADEAVEISKAVGAPVQVVWNRADDMRAGFFHPASVERMAATLGRRHGAGMGACVGGFEPFDVRAADGGREEGPAAVRED